MNFLRITIEKVESGTARFAAPGDQPLTVYVGTVKALQRAAILGVRPQILPPGEA